MISDSTFWMYHKSTHLQPLGWSLDPSSECESWQTVRGSVLNALQLSEWTASGRPRLLLFTFPATYSYLLLITLPPSVVTKTQSNLPGSAWHHTDRRALTHFVGELADSFLFISFPFFSPPSQAKSALLSGSLTGWCFRTKDNRVGWVTTIKKKPARRPQRRKSCTIQERKEQTVWCSTCVLASRGGGGGMSLKEQDCVKVSRRCRWFELFSSPVCVFIVAATQTFIRQCHTVLYKSSQGAGPSSWTESDCWGEVF